MTVNTISITSGPYAGNSVTADFSYGFKIESVDQIRVLETDDEGVQLELVETTDYTVSGVGDDGGGIVTRVAGALPTGYSLYIRSDYDLTQLTNFASQGGFYPEVHENAFDKLTFLLQQMQDSVDRSVRANAADESGGLGELPIRSSRADKLLGFDSNGDLAVYTVADIVAGLNNSAVNTYTASFALDETNVWDYNIINGAVSAVNIALPDDPNDVYATGAEWHVRLEDNVTTLIVETGAASAWVPAGGSLELAGEGSTVTIKKVATNVYAVMGRVFSP